VWRTALPGVQLPSEGKVEQVPLLIVAQLRWLPLERTILQLQMLLDFVRVLLTRRRRHTLCMMPEELKKLTN